MEVHDFEMPSPKRQRTNSPVESVVPPNSHIASEPDVSVSTEPKQQEMPDVLDFLMQHVESESKPQQVMAASANEPLQAVPDNSTAVTTEQSQPSLLDQNVNGPPEQMQESAVLEIDNLSPAQPVASVQADEPRDIIPQNPELAPAVADGITNAEQDGPAEAREWETDSSPYSSDSSDTTDSSDEDSDEDDEDDPDAYVLLDPLEQARILMAEDGGGAGDSDDEGNHSKSTKVPNTLRTINEKPETILPKPDIVVTSATPIEELGSVTFFVENTLLITAKVSGEYQVLESGSVLCLGAPSYAVIGAVAETLGRVEEPLYTVRFASETDVRETFGLNGSAEKNIAEPQSDSIQGDQLQEKTVAGIPEINLAAVLKNTPIFYVKSHSTFVFTQPLRSAKGTDASNIHDEEVGEEEQEFSDDEAEAEYKRMQKLKKKGIDPSTLVPPGSRGRGGGYRGGRGQRGGGDAGYSNGYHGSSYNTGQQDTVMNYDDAPMDEGELASVEYTPLRRPEAMQQSPPQQEYNPPSEYQRGRGRGRGGRGGSFNNNSRGRGGGGRGRGGYQNQHSNQNQYQSQAPGNSYGNTSELMSNNAPYAMNNNFSNNANVYANPASMYPTYQPQMPTTDFSFQAQAQSQWAQYHANQNQQYQQYGGQQPGIPNFNAEALAQVQRQLEEMRRQGQGFQ